MSKPVVYEARCGQCGKLRYLKKKPPTGYICRWCRPAKAPPPPPAAAAKAPAPPPPSGDPFYRDAERRTAIEGHAPWLPARPDWLKR